MRKISKYAIINKNSTIAKNVLIGEYSVIGKNAIHLNERCKTKIQTDSFIGSHVIIYEGTVVGKRTQVEDFCRIGENTIIGADCRLIYGTKIYGDVEIGNKCVIGGFICEDVNIGNCCRIFGELIHKHKSPELSNIKIWDEGGAQAPIIEDDVFIGFGAKIIGGIKIGNGSYIFPNAIVTKDIPPNSEVKGINCFTAIK